MPAEAAVRVLILTAPVGEGHVAAARTLAEDIRQRHPSSEVIVVDALEAFNLALRFLLRDAYRWQLARASWLFGVVFAGLQQSRILRCASRILLSVLGSRSIRRVVRAHHPDVIVSTFPATTTILGCLRLRSQVDAPVCATITDFGGVEMWVDRGVDLHLVMHESLLPAVERVAGPGSGRVVNPLVAEQFLTPREPMEARRSLGLPLDGRIVAVSGGGWGVGDLDGAVRAALALADVFVVCLAGREPATKKRLELAFASDPRVAVLGFTDRMSDLLAAADVLVHSTGGVTCLEALALGCPIVAYGVPRGHAPALAREMAALGLLVHARSSVELHAALSPDLRTVCGALSYDDDAADLVLAARSRVTPRIRARAARPLALAAAAAVMAVGIFSSDLTYPLVAEAFSLSQTRTVEHAGGAVLLVVSGDSDSLLAFAPIAARHHLHGSVMTSGPLLAGQVAVLRAAGLDPIPGITSGGVRSSLAQRGRLNAQARAYDDNVGGHFYFLAPRDGFTIADYLVARDLGGIPLQASGVLGHRDADLRPGEIVTAELKPGPAAATNLLQSWLRLARSVRHVSSVPALRTTA